MSTATITAPKDAVRLALKGQSLLLHDISWKQYKALVEVFMDQSIFLNYFRGKLEIMVKGRTHEIEKSFLARLLEFMAFEKGIDIVGFGEATWNRADLECGLEPDECYYVKHAAAIQHKKDINLERDPPPDLAIEIEASRKLLDRRMIYAALGVPELWCYDGKSLRFLRLNARGEYVSCDRSVSFHIRSADLERFLKLTESKTQLAVLREFQAWLRGKQK